MNKIVSRRLRRFPEHWVACVPRRSFAFSRYDIHSLKCLFTFHCSLFTPVVLAVVISLSIILFSGCDKRTEVSAPTQFTDTIMPLAVGNYWMYTDTTFVNGEPDSIQVAKIGITGTTQISYEGQSRWVYHWSWYDMPEDKAQTRKTLVTNEPDGLVYYGQKMGANYTEFNRRLFIKYPVEVNEQWNYVGGAVVRCLSDSVSFETPAGRFDAYEYRMTKGVQVQYLYYVPEVGYVGMKALIDGNLTKKRRLTEYRVKE